MKNSYHIASIFGIMRGEIHAYNPKLVKCYVCFRLHILRKSQKGQQKKNRHHNRHNFTTYWIKVLICQMETFIFMYICVSTKRTYYKNTTKMAFFENNSKSFSKIFQNPTKKCCLRKIYRKDFGQHTKKYNLCHFIHVFSTHRRRYYGNAHCHEVSQEMFHKIIQYGLPTL